MFVDCWLIHYGIGFCNKIYEYNILMKCILDFWYNLQMNNVCKVKIGIKLARVLTGFVLPIKISFTTLLI